MTKQIKEIGIKGVSLAVRTGLLMPSFLLLFLAGASTLLGKNVTDRRTATITGGGGEGKCTIEVSVDDVAQVAIRGREASITTISGAPSSFVRFQCNQEMPNRPSGFRFKGVDGRGRQELVNSPESGGNALIRIEDSKGGRENFTFDIYWNAGSGSGWGSGSGFGSNNSGFGNDSGFGNNNSGFGGGWNNGWGNGSGWNNQAFNYSGGRYGAGKFRNNNGQWKRLDNARVIIGASGKVAVSFDGEPGNIEFTGNVNSRNNRRVYTTVSGGGRTGQMVIEMSSYNQVSKITMGAWNLTWSN